MSAFPKFDPVAYLEERGLGPAKVANPANFAARTTDFSTISKISMGATLPADSWDATDWQAFFDERAAMAEFDGNASRSVAEGRAFQACIVEWLNRHPPSSLSPPDRCAACGKMEALGASIVPFGTSAHVWLHPTCWRGWHHKRITDAETALKALSIGARL